MLRHGFDRSPDSFERWSDSYDRSYMQWLLFDRVHRAVLDAVPAGLQPGVVLDIGCGTGRLLRKVGARWPQAQLLGLDLARGMIVHAHAAMPEGGFIVGPAETLPLPDGSVDFILSTVSFHHWQDQNRGVREVARVLRPGGYFYLADVNPPGWVNRIYHHGTMVSRGQLRAIFDQAKLKLVSQQPVLAWSFYLTVGEKM